MNDNDVYLHTDRSVAGWSVIEGLAIAEKLLLGLRVTTQSTREEVGRKNRFCSRNQGFHCSILAMNLYRFQAEEFMRHYILGNSCVPYTSILVGILMCKMAYDVTEFISSLLFKSYKSLTKIQRIEWNNRGMSSIHAIFIAVMALYLVFFSNLFSDDLQNGLITSRSSCLSTFTLGVSVGYFVADLALIYWLYPALGGMEFVVHHTLSLFAIAYSVLSGEGQLYTYMVLISEATTPGINLRWFLDTTGLKGSNAYIANGVFMFFAWLAARILLFCYLFYHVYQHYNQIEQMQTVGYLLVFCVPSALAVMNAIWFGKILKGLKKHLSKKK